MGCTITLIRHYNKISDTSQYSSNKIFDKLHFCITYLILERSWFLYEWVIITVHSWDSDSKFIFIKHYKLSYVVIIPYLSLSLHRERYILIQQLQSKDIFTLIMPACFIVYFIATMTFDFKHSYFKQETDAYEKLVSFCSIMPVLQMPCYS